MKCAIFLLALCAFERVFAVIPFVTNLNHLHQQSTIRLKGVMAAFEIFVTAEIQGAQRRNTQVNHCMRLYDEMEQYYQNVIAKCNDCYARALLQHKDIKQVQECYAYNFRAFQNEGMHRRRAVNICIKAILAGHPYLPRSAAGPLT